MRYTVVIPSRYASTRLPGKPLLDIMGKPMVVRVAKVISFPMKVKAQPTTVWVLTVNIQHPAVAFCQEAFNMHRVSIATSGGVPCDCQSCISPISLPILVVIF